MQRPRRPHQAIGRRAEFMVVGPIRKTLAGVGGPARSRHCLAVRASIDCPAPIPLVAAVRP